MTRLSLSVAFVVLGAGMAAAQPAPAPAPAPTTPPADQAQPPAATEPAPTAVEPPVVVEGPPPAEVKKDEKPVVTATYDNGLKFETADGKYELKLSFRNQMRFESNRSLDEDTPTLHHQFLNTFYIPRSRFQAEGFLFGKDNRFKVELGMGDAGSFSFIKDMFMEKRLPDSPIYVRFGQWKRPYNRAELISDFASTFNERSIENELAGGGRSLGVALHNDYEKSPEGIGWAFGMFDTFNGGSDRPTWTTACVAGATGAITCVNSRPTTFPIDFGPTLVARVDWNSPKIKGYTGSDLEGGPLRYSIGAAYKVDLANLNKGNQASWGDNMSQSVEVDAIVKSNGLALEVGAVMMKIKTADPEWGFYLQPALMIDPKHLEVAGRFALTTVTVPGAMGATIDRDQIEARAALNYYFYGHTFKLANDGGFVMLTGDQPASDKPDLQFRVMMQLVI